MVPLVCKRMLKIKLKRKLIFHTMLDALHTLYLNVKLSCEVSPAPHLLDEKKKKNENDLPKIPS